MLLLEERRVVAVALDRRMPLRLGECRVISRLGEKHGHAFGQRRIHIEYVVPSDRRSRAPPAAVTRSERRPHVVEEALGAEALAGLLVGALITGVMLGIQMANSGGAMDNAKKYVEEGNFGGKGSDTHKATVIGDTVGDPLKDTVGPSINILIKLMAVISLVLAPLFI